MTSKTLDAVGRLFATIAYTCLTTGITLLFGAFVVFAMAGPSVATDTVAAYTVATVAGVTAVYGMVTAGLGLAFFGGLADIAWAYEFRARLQGR